ncbi:MAG: 16S rRNA (guanine(966)-N(2))-methyltransferase RsmD [Bacteroidales bacterium]
MRIISGKYKGKTIQVPTNYKLRPTTDFAKESLFNIISNFFDFENLKVLDLFAGTGSITLEFCSRGVEHITSVEKQPLHSKFIANICAELEFKQVQIITADVFKYIEKLNESFDIIFADPPYKLPNINIIPDIIFNNKILSRNGILIIEHGSTTSFLQHKQFYTFKKYGSVHFSFFEHKDNTSS